MPHFLRGHENGRSYRLTEIDCPGDTVFILKEKLHINGQDQSFTASHISEPIENGLSRGPRQREMLMSSKRKRLRHANL